MIIQDDELRQLFKAESEEHLQCLEQGLLRLEEMPGDDTVLEEVFRAAHSLKGAARMLEVGKVEAVAHRFEDMLGTARRGTVKLTPDAVDRLYHAVDSIREFCHEAITGDPSGSDVAEVLERLGAECPGEPPAEDRPAPSAAEPEPVSLPETEIPAPAVDSRPAEAPPAEEAVTPAEPAALVPADQPPAEIAPAEASPGPPTGDLAPTGAEPSTRAKGPADYSIDTIRVPARKLDSLMSHAGELLVTRGRVAHRVGEVERLLALWEEWNRDFYTVRGFAGESNGQHGPRTLERVREYLHRSRQRINDVGKMLKGLDTAVKGDDTRLDALATQLEEGIRAVRLLPLSTVFNLFPRMVRDLAKDQEKELSFVIEGADTTADKRIIEELKDPLTHMIRNAVDHGIEQPEDREQSGKPAKATVVLRAAQLGANVVIELQDDGRGIDVERVKEVALKRKVCTAQQLAEMSDSQIRHLIFAPGFSTTSIVTDVSGRGVGMDVVRANVERLRGSIEVISVIGKGTTFRLVLPLTLATRRVLIVAVEGRHYAIPVEHVQTTRLMRRDEIFTMQGRGTTVLDGQPVSVARLADLLELPPAPQTETGNGREDKGQGGTTQEEGKGQGQTAGAAEFACIILVVDGERYGLLVDDLLDEQEVVLKPHGTILQRVRNVSGSTILQSGEVCVALNPFDLLRSARGKSGQETLDAVLAEEDRKKVVLLAEDSMVTRTQEKRILEGAGFEVITAVDGADAYNKLANQHVDAIVSDVEMPNLDGLSFTAKVRQNPQYKDLPVILVTSLASDADRRRGMEVGADAYLTKPGFDQTVFLETVRRFA